MSITFQPESVTDIRAEALPLLSRHWEEIALNKDRVPLDPDWTVYDHVEAAGGYHVTTARDNGALIGYASAFLSRNAHYRSLIVSEADIFWLDPAYRKGMTGARLLTSSEHTAVGRGANKVILKTKLNPNLGPLFERLGYLEIERIYAKVMV